MELKIITKKTKLNKFEATIDLSECVDTLPFNLSLVFVDDTPYDAFNILRVYLLNNNHTVIGWEHLEDNVEVEEKKCELDPHDKFPYLSTSEVRYFFDEIDKTLDIVLDKTSIIRIIGLINTFIMEKDFEGRYKSQQKIFDDNISSITEEKSIVLPSNDEVNSDELCSDNGEDEKWDDQFTHKIRRRQFENMQHFERMFRMNADTIQELCSEERADVVYGFELGKLHTWLERHRSDLFDEVQEISSQKL